MKIIIAFCIGGKSQRARRYLGCHRAGLFTQTKWSDTGTLTEKAGIVLRWSAKAGRRLIAWVIHAPRGAAATVVSYVGSWGNVIWDYARRAWEMLTGCGVLLWSVRRSRETVIKHTNTVQQLCLARSKPLSGIRRGNRKNTTKYKWANKKKKNIKDVLMKKDKAYILAPARAIQISFTLPIITSWWTLGCKDPSVLYYPTGVAGALEPIPAISDPGWGNTTDRWPSPSQELQS